jgi:hypothetical protein
VDGITFSSDEEAYVVFREGADSELVEQWQTWLTEHIGFAFANGIYFSRETDLELVKSLISALPVDDEETR